MKKLYFLIILFFIFSNLMASDLTQQKLKKLNEQADQIEAAKAKLPAHKQKIADLLLSKMSNFPIPFHHSE